MHNVTILGATGAIGMRTLQVIDLHPKRYRVFALTANRDIETLAKLCQKYKPTYAVLAQKSQAMRFEGMLRALQITTEVWVGDEALQEIAAHTQNHIVMSAISGAAALLPTLAAASAGKRVLLANKEALVMAGGLLKATAQKHQASLIPVDSEHNAILQCLPDDYQMGERPKTVQSITLTASGGALRDLPKAALSWVTKAQVLQHPNWEMGAKITVDSATMMNKGLELIEAQQWFDLPAERLCAVLHPQSLVHGWVQYTDGSIIAHLGPCDMRVPIACALAFPERIESGANYLDFNQVCALHFEPISKTRYPCFALAQSVLRTKGAGPIILNAANEVAVDAFLNQHLPFCEIAAVVADALEKIPHQQKADTLAEILSIDQAARRVAKAACQFRGKN